MRNVAGAIYYYIKYYARNLLRDERDTREFLYRHYAGKKFYDTMALSRRVSSLIADGAPFMMGRFGAVELFAMRTDEFRLKGKAEKAMAQLYTNAGFFPKDPSLLPRFNDVMKDACAEADFLGCWQNPCEDYYLKKYCKSLEAVSMLISLEPWRSPLPWSGALAGKRVLIVHPFEESVKRQYAKRELLFPGTDILPAFDLLTLKAVQTAGDARDDRFSDWFDALSFMCAECDKADFDIALIGCGAYGFPLAAHIKRTGRQAVHLGGSLQILFGIKGRRWDELEPDVAAMYNDAWSYPLKSEVPAGSDGIEGATYWKES